MTATVEELRERLESEGFEETFDPKLSGFANTRQIDEWAARTLTCSGCGRRGCTYVAFQNPDTTLYRAIAVCRDCGTAVEL